MSLFMSVIVLFRLADYLSGRPYVFESSCS